MTLARGLVALPEPSAPPASSLCPDNPSQHGCWAQVSLVQVVCLAAERGHVACEQEQGEHNVVFYQLTVHTPRGLPPLLCGLHCIALCYAFAVSLICVLHTDNMSTPLHCSEKCKSVGSILVLLAPACNYTTSSLLAQLFIPDL